MAKKNAYLEKKKEMQDTRDLLIRMDTEQLMCDSFMMTLNDPKYVGKDVFGEKRLNLIAEGISYYYHQLIVGLTNRPEASYVRHWRNERLKKICKDSFQPWEECYPAWYDKGI